MSKIGIIDLGSNSVRVNIVLIEKESFKTIFSDRNTVKLSENMNSDMQLKPKAIQRTIDALLEYKNLFDTMGVDKIHAVATAAVRKAKNGNDFLKLAKAKTGISIQVIDGKKEAEYDYLAVKETMNISDCVIMDIGGGSTEIIGVRSGKVQNFISIPLASRNITETFLLEENSQKITDAENFVYKHISSVAWLSDFEKSPIIGLGGCLRALSKVICEKNNIIFKSGCKIDISEINSLYEKLKSMSLKDRITLVGEDRGDIILGGAIPFMTVSKIINPSILYVSDKGVRDGIIYSILESTKN